MIRIYIIVLTRKETQLRMAESICQLYPDKVEVLVTILYLLTMRLFSILYLPVHEA